MKALNSRQIREKFIEYFEKNAHAKINASSLVPKNDPTLLFINSGMAPLKNYFLGKETPESKMLCNFQPCIRTKDIDDVGDRHHLTLFEMLGSWSIGDYYKEKAIELAYKLLIDEFGFDPKKLYMTVYKGNKKLGIAPDKESIAAWKKVGVPDNHIIEMGDDNFWGPAGETGPCGPCTEVFYDTGEKYGPEYKPGGHFDDVNRYIEIWNAGVFMELNKQKDGSFIPLPLKSVDTGSGLERMAMVMNGHESVYETDLMLPLMKLSGELLLNSKEPKEILLKKTRMISDHMRAAVLILSEGVMPSNEGQGYIPRRLLRKVVAALMSSGVSKINLGPHVDKVVELLSDYYPLLKSALSTIKYNIENEVKEFTPIVKSGIEKINEELTKKEKVFSGKFAFELVTTFGLPLDVLKSELEDKNIKLNQKEYDQCYEQHRNASRVISRSGASTDEGVWDEVLQKFSAPKFVGYKQEKVEGAKVICLVRDGQVVESLKAGDEAYILTDMTPFYGESGGQIGDSGEILAASLKAEVIDTIKKKDHIFHFVKIKSGEVKTADVLELRINTQRRNSIKKHHSATHLLHAALHQVVGKHAIQKGSLVTEDKLRFDFQNNKPLALDETKEIEKIVNEWIQQGSVTQSNLMAYDKAIELGAMALFGEKYDSDVRVIQFGNESVELCGGTHVSNTGEIGFFAITGESSVAKGIRRLEAVVGMKAIAYFQQRDLVLADVCKDLNCKPHELKEKLKSLKKKQKEGKKETSSSLKVLKEDSVKIGGSIYFLKLIDGDIESIKSYGDKVIDKNECQLLTILNSDGKSLKAFTWVKKELTSKCKAGDLLKNILAPVEGKGGGRPHFAQGGSQQAGAVDVVFGSFSDSKKWIEQKLS